MSVLKQATIETTDRACVNCGEDAEGNEPKCEFCETRFLLCADCNGDMSPESVCPTCSHGWSKND
jgi:hypothetical protein